MVLDSRTDRLKSLNLALDVLESLSGGGGGLGVSTVAHQVRTSKGAVHRILANLEARGYVRQDPETRRYRVGLRMWELGASSVQELGLREVALPHLRTLTDITDENSHLSVYDEGTVVYLEKISSRRAVTPYTRVGGRAPAYCVSTGKALLAFQPPEEIDRVCSSVLTAYTAQTITDPDELRSELAEIRRQGYAINRGEWRGEVVGIAAPLLDYTGSVVASISLSAPAYRFTVQDAETYAPKLIAAGRAISRELGYRREALWERSPQHHAKTRP
ncbi:MAG: IclR family transcriptional regulator [Actinomycetota bacterium]